MVNRYEVLRPTFKALINCICLGSYVKVPQLMRLIRPLLVFITLLITGCGLGPVKDGPPDEKIDISHIKDAVPTPAKVPLKDTPYIMDGVTYEPMSSANGYSEEGLASWYGTKFHGKQTANGEIYDLYKMTAAHKTLPLPSYVKVTNKDNQKSIVVRVNDRGPFHSDRLIDLSYVAARKLGFVDSGIANVSIEGIDPETFTDSAAHQDKGEELYLQLAALKNFHSAQLMRREVFRKSGVKANVFFQDGSDAEETMYRVRIGPIESPDHLETLLESLNASGFEAPYLVYKKEEQKNMVKQP